MFIFSTFLFRVIGSIVKINTPTNKSRESIINDHEIENQIFNFNLLPNPIIVYVW